MEDKAPFNKSEATHVPALFVLPLSDRPDPILCLSDATLPIIDLSSLHHPSFRSTVVDQIRSACQKTRSFQVINHGIPLPTMEKALQAAQDFFDLPSEKKMQLMSDDVHAPVRYGTSLNHSVDKVHFWRDFIKHYSHPISQWIHVWPADPPTYRETMRNYTEALHTLQTELMGAIMESLGLNRDYLKEEIKQGSQVITVNSYPPCPEPQLVLGMPPHSDYGTLTILLQSCAGLQLLDSDNSWFPAPETEGALIVQLGDQLEVMSNGQYKSVIHRVTVNSMKKRFSVASLHSLALHTKMGPAKQLVDEQHPPSYKEFSFRDFLEYISGNDIVQRGRFIDTLKTKPRRKS